MPRIDHDDARHLQIDQFHRSILALQLHADAGGVEGDRRQVDADGGVAAVVHGGSGLFLADTGEPGGSERDRQLETVAMFGSSLRPVAPEHRIARHLAFFNRLHEQGRHRPCDRLADMVTIRSSLAPDPNPQFAMRDAVDRRFDLDHRVFVRNRLGFGRTLHDGVFFIKDLRRERDGIDMQHVLRSFDQDFAAPGVGSGRGDRMGNAAIGDSGSSTGHGSPFPHFQYHVLDVGRTHDKGAAQRVGDAIERGTILEQDAIRHVGQRCAGRLVPQHKAFVEQLGSRIR
ncbi:hypothetical protein WQ56_16365 [Luteimonas sp. FCS-9]|nr:hypothetical protein WQ56_16365 [Luteimonas sp. FCS-9]